MTIEGYEQIGTGDMCDVFVRDDAWVQLGQFVREGGRTERNALALEAVLERLTLLGPNDMKNTEQFKHEGKFPALGNPPRRVSVLVAKADQLRLYGGYFAGREKTTIRFELLVKKKTNKANQNLLKRVARML